MKGRTYIAVDLKSFYASVECIERGLDPMTTNLVVADASRTEKTICLAVTPSLKAYGISGRARLFEVVQKVKAVNAERQRKAPGQVLAGASCNAEELARSPELALDYIVAPPRMAHYMEHSAKIYNVYLKYIAPEDIHVYSIDEVLMDVTDYLKTYKLTAREIARKMILDVLKTTGITSAAGIGTNLYLAKVAMDIGAKHSPVDENGVRIAELDKMTYRRTLWTHRPLTDFWRVGKGYPRKLEAHGMFTMGDVARCSIQNEDLLYKLFGVNAELLIDHAWGYEPCTMAAIKAYKPSTSSIGSGQVLQCAYSAEKARLVIREMADALALDLVDKKLMTNQLTITVGYDIENLKDPRRKKAYQGEITKDAYGREVPKHAHGTENLPSYSSSTRQILSSVSDLYDRIVDRNLLIRRLNITANNVIAQDEVPKAPAFEQLDLFSDYQEVQAQKEKEKAQLEREKKMQEAMLAIKKKFGKNAILKGMNLEKGATAKERNQTIGGHRAGDENEKPKG